MSDSPGRALGLLRWANKSPEEIQRAMQEISKVRWGTGGTAVPLTGYAREQVSLARESSPNDPLQDSGESTILEIMDQPLKARRMKLHLTQRSLALAAGISESYLGVLERGESTPTLRIARRLAEVLGTTLDALWPASVAPGASCEAEEVSK